MHELFDLPCHCGALTANDPAFKNDIEKPRVVLHQRSQSEGETRG